jgi:hypothetical protein
MIKLGWCGAVQNMFVTYISESTDKCPLSFLVITLSLNLKNFRILAYIYDIILEFEKLQDIGLNI